ncbi:hypothetical protein GCM10023340_21950 [Nocardioides marinquilinus]|uniref:DUF305 domain-containing protein n=1 Tax=Nocardioides marinquilinus TaxID=1210400 RepID=A0ABP9PKV2_9ACTN
MRLIRGRRAVAAATVVLTTLGAVLVSGCAGEQTTQDAAGSAPPVVDGSADHPVHGASDGAAMPGMEPVPEPPEDADWNAADATYLSMMVAHHSQALDLAELAATRARDPRVRRLAESIDAGQGREIIVMATWLVDHGLPEPTVEGVEHMTEMGMPGMLTTEQVDDLAQTSGPAFDRRFLEDMVQHHQGAVRMAEDHLGSGEDVRVTEMATDVVVTQNAEIARMRDLLAVLP